MYHSLRNLSGLIRDHVEITKDKFGEIVLNAFMLRKSLDETNEQLKRYDRWTAYKLYTYIIARAYMILLLLSKTHLDLHMDVYDDIVALGHHIQEKEHLLSHALTCSFDVNWMIDFEISDKIHEIHNAVSAKGYLR